MYSVNNWSVGNDILKESAVRRLLDTEDVRSAILRNVIAA
jgi:hypothetical protein